MSQSDESKRLARDEKLARYNRQMLYAQIGEEGQRNLLASRVTLVGCGALGTVIADTLARAGVGNLRIVDRDYVELNNLQRQVLFDERDVEVGSPKAVAAAEKLMRINSAIRVEPVVADVHSANIEELCKDAHLILDGTDNFETRFLINDAAVKLGKPWVYGACVGVTGMVMPIIPGETPCLRCVWDEPPPPGMNPTCDTAGVLGPVVHLVAALQCMEAIKLLTGRLDAVNRKLVQIDAWTGAFSDFELSNSRDAGSCVCCGQGRYEYLDAKKSGRTASLCGRMAVQVSAGPSGVVDLPGVAARIAPVANSPPQLNRYLLRFSVEQYEITLFRDGRAIIKGTNEPEVARTVYAKYVGS